MRWLLATLSFAAGAIHLVMVPQHAQESMRVGLAFAAAGWFQIAFGAAMLAAPRRIWVQLAVAANLLFVATWAISRSVGLPDWTGDGGTEAAQSVDILCVVLEAAVVVGAIALLVAPRMLEHWKLPAVTVTALVSVGVIVGTTAVLASPGTANHSHDSEAAHTSDGHDHGADPAETADHAHDLEGLELTGDHPHGESEISYDELPAATKAEVDQVIEAFATKYPTGADATLDGWFKATPSLYGIGSHYVKQASFSVAAPFDLLNPPVLLYDGEGPDAKFAGVSYIVADDDPDGFSGDFDVWHGHASVCQGPGGITLIEEESDVWYSETECLAHSGRVMPIANDNMMHLWIGPEYIDRAPIFAHDHPDLFDGYNPQRDG